MALITHIDNKALFVSGVYVSQMDPILFGQQELPSRIKNDSPHVIGFLKGDDSVTMQAFFDPERSSLAKDIKNVPVSYIQVGQFRINQIPLPVEVNVYNPPYLNLDPEGVNGFNWVDVATEDSEGKNIMKPYYPFWSLSNDASATVASLFKFPQSFGGFTQLIDQPDSAREADDFLTAFMRTNLQINLGRIPTTASADDYFNDIDVDNLSPIKSLQELELPLDNINPENLLKRLIEKEFLPPAVPFSEFNITRATKNSRFYFTYKTQTQLRGRPKPIISDVHALVWHSGEEWKMAMLDEDLIEEFRDFIAREGAPDLTELRKLIYDQANKKSVTLGFPFTLSYQYITYACAIPDGLNTNASIKIKMLEGFGWKAHRTFNQKQWEPTAVELYDIDNNALREQATFRNTIDKYFKKISGQVTWM